MTDELQPTIKKVLETMHEFNENVGKSLDKEADYILSKDKFKAVHVNDLIKMTPKPFPWVANNIIPENALTIIHPYLQKYNVLP